MLYKDLRAAAVEQKAVINLTPKYIEFKEAGQSVLGRFLSKAAVTGKLSTQSYFQYTFNTDEGNVKFHLGAATDKTIGVLMVEGKVYILTYKGEQKIQGGRRVRVFDADEIPGDVGAPVATDSSDSLPI